MVLSLVLVYRPPYPSNWNALVTNVNVVATGIGKAVVLDPGGTLTYSSHDDNYTYSQQFAF